MYMKRLEMTGGGYISVSGFMSGTTGNMSINASESITMSGVGISGINMITGNNADNATGGNISIITPQLRMDDSGVISTNSAGTERAGDIKLDLGRLIMTGGAFVWAGSTGAGDGGNIEIEAGNINMSSGAAVSVKSEGKGDAGDIMLSASDRLDMNGSSVTATAVGGDGGNIKISAKKIINLNDSEISSTVNGENGNGGNIIIDPDFLVLNKSKIVADAVGGNGGNISMSAGRFIASSDSVVSASSNLGIDGTVVIDAPKTDIHGKVTPISADYLKGEEMVPAYCAARKGVAGGLVVKGRDGLPPSPEAPLASMISLYDETQNEMAALMEKGDYKQALTVGAKRGARSGGEWRFQRTDCRYAQDGGGVPGHRSLQGRGRDGRISPAACKTGKSA